jgi:hypothetical protein
MHNDRQFAVCPFRLASTLKIDHSSDTGTCADTILE